MSTRLKNHGIMRYRRYIAAAVLIVSLTIGFAVGGVIVHAEGQPIIDSLFAKAGIPEGGFFTFGMEKIENFLQLCDDGMKGAGVETHFEDIWTDAKTNAVDAFSEIDNEEDAWNMLEDYVRMYE